MTKSNHRRILGWTLVGYATALVTGTHLPRDVLYELPESDKLVHLLAYTGLAILATAYCKAIQGHLDIRLFAMILGLTVFAAVDEFTQRFVPGRHSDVADWQADTLGVLLGTLGYWCWARYWTSKEE